MQKAGRLVNLMIAIVGVTVAIPDMVATVQAGGSEWYLLGIGFWVFLTASCLDYILGELKFTVNVRKAD